MTSMAAVLLGVPLLLSAACAGSGETTIDPHAAAPEPTLVGQLLLPSGLGSRGVEILVRIAAPGSEPHVEWVLFDEQGHFAHSFGGNVTSVTVTAGDEVLRVDRVDLPKLNKAGQVDLGIMDLRDRLTDRRVLVRAADGRPGGDVRVGMWFGPPPVGPQGEPVSLGSRQFPPVALGSEVAWLLPHEAHSIYFLVERPLGSGRGTEWRSGPQQLFGPFALAEFPAELVMN